ncbi:MAG: PA14 domain-containing protein [Planctomycetaceae bacterium]|nr:PA14 domain-containing protein [Planctomycetaceae bacterium]
MRRFFTQLAMCLAAVCLPSPAIAQDDDDESRPGLISTATGQYRRGQELVADVSLRTMLPEQDFRGDKNSWQQEWHGQLLLKSEGKYRFHAFVHGGVKVQLGERLLLDDATDQPAWVSGPETELSFGEFPFLVTFTHAPTKGYGLKLYWSSDTFPLEPLPHHVLFHTADSTALRLAKIGRQQTEAANCYWCHHVDWHESSLPQYSLMHVGSGRSWGAIRERLMRRDADPKGGHMPAYGLSVEDATAVMAYLAKHAEPVQLTDPPKVKVNEKETPTGRELLKSVGCLACHEWQGLGQLPVFGGGKLDDVATRRTRAWLDQWLRDPAAVNRSHRMPVFKLTDAERQQIVSTLIGEHKFPRENAAPKITDELVNRGRQVIASARCVACHEISGNVRQETTTVRYEEPGKPFPITAENAIARKGCLSAEPDPKKYRPAFHQVDPAAIAAMVTPGTIHRLRMSDLERNGCVNCHDRDGSRGLSNIALALLKSEPQWQGQTPTLTPPPLTAVGDRLQDAALAKAVRGELPVRLPWLKVRMPKFREAQVAGIPAELIDHDRIPDAAPETPQYPIAEGRASPDVLLAGRELTGGKGFSCVACHQLKDYVPPKVALGTRGSDLYRLGERMRAPYFFRWTRSPLRILPGVEMPSYQRPHPTLMGGELDRQLAAIWDALHDPQFTAPTNPAVVEQLWGPSDAGRARILRDVVTIPDADGKTTSVPRSFAVGFANRHSVLFDLERGAVRMWTIGDFARQRTQGKSWFWDMAGVPVAADAAPAADVYLYDERTRSVIAPETGWTAEIKMQFADVQFHYGVELNYEMTWRHPDVSVPVRVVIQERWNPFDPTTIQHYGWVREVVLRDSLSDYTAWLRQPKLDEKLGPVMSTVSPEYTWHQPHANAPEAAQIRKERKGFELPLRVVYSTPIQPPELTSNPVPAVQVAPQPVTSLPGYQGVRLPLPRSIMPTAMTWHRGSRLYFTSLKGHVYGAFDSDGDKLEDRLTTMAEGLAAPFGIISIGVEDLLVVHKPEALVLNDRDDDGVADRFDILASGWGYTDDYHDWTTGLVRDSQGWYYLGLGSDYAHKNRPAAESKYRGHILRFNLDGKLEPVATGLRYPVGLAMTADDRLFVTDQQGVQNCFNEIDFIQMGKRYGVPAKLDKPTDDPAEIASVQVPHPWTRSVNGLCVWPEASGHPFAGHLIGAEYNTRFLIRASLQTVDGVTQGGVYPLSKPGETNGPEELLGPICVAFSPDGDLYVGSLHDSGWLGGLNTGDIVRFRANGELPNGLREVRATRDGFAIEFVHPLDDSLAAKPQAYTISGYTRVWQGEYATPDSARHNVTVKTATLSDDRRTVRLSLDGLKTGHVYDIAVGNVAGEKRLWPHAAVFTLHKAPAK